MIEQAKFAYSPLGKAFEKQTNKIEKQKKAIEDQGEKQIKAIQYKGLIKSIKNFASNIDDSPIVLKEKKIYNKVIDEVLEKNKQSRKKVLILKS